MRFLQLDAAKYSVKKRTFLLCSDTARLDTRRGRPTGVLTEVFETARSGPINVRKPRRAFIVADLLQKG